MILASESDRLLNVAFSSLNPRDKYETVLTGLCAKIIDGGAANAKEGMVDPMRLMEEMNSGRIAAGPRGVIGLIDVSVYRTCLTFNDVALFHDFSFELQSIHSYHN